MESDNKNFSPDLRQALLRYNARFPLPVDFIADTMLEINRVAERRAYVRGLILISLMGLLMVALAVVMFSFVGIKFTMTLPLLSTVIESFTFVESVIVSPLTIMLVVASLILLTLDHLMRRRFAAHHASAH